MQRKKSALLTVGLIAGIGVGLTGYLPASSFPPAVSVSHTGLSQNGLAQASPDPVSEPNGAGTSDSTSADGARNDFDADSANTDSTSAAPNRPVNRSTPTPTMSPVVPKPITPASSAPQPPSSSNPEDEIREIRSQLIQLLTRLEQLEAQLKSNPGIGPTQPQSSPPQPVVSSTPFPTPEPNLFFEGSPPPQLSLGTQTISLPGDVLFDFNQSDIRPEAASMLEQVAEILESMPFAHVQVAGHTDNVGDSEYNLVLSVKRATSVQDFLKGVLPEEGQGYRWTTAGYGEAAPVADNKTEEGRQRNRRVDLIISPQ